jgi:hypothetical protein
MVKATRSSETMIFYRNTTKRHNSEHRDLNLHRRENLKSHILKLSFMSFRMNVQLPTVKTDGGMRYLRNVGNVHHCDMVLYPEDIRACIQTFPDWVIRKYMLTTINTSWEAIQRVMAAELTRLTHKIVMQLQLVEESCTICSSRARWPVRKLLDTLS